MASTPKQHIKRHRARSSIVKELKTLHAVQQFDGQKKQLKQSQQSSSALASCKLVTSIMPQVEHKEIIPPYRGKDYPTSLYPPPSGFRFEETKESITMRNTFRKMFSDKHYRFRISTALNMSSSGAGAINSVVNVSALQFAGDFLSLASVFNEFFVIGMHLQWIPVSRYQYPLGGTSTLSVANLPMGVASLQHGASAYSSLATMAENYAIAYHSSGDPFSYSWINPEKVSETVLAVQSGAVQSWCTTGNVANYSGVAQFLSQSAPPALPFTQVLGTFLVHWDIMFRVRE